MLQSAISGPDGAVDPKIAAELIAHFTARTKSLRAFMTDVTDNMVTAFDGMLADDRRFPRSLLANQFRENPQILISWSIHDEIRTRLTE